MQTYRHIKVEHRGDLCCVRLRRTRLEETEIQQLGEELISLGAGDGCRNVALSLGPEPPDCLYSIFLAKLVAVRNTLARADRRLVLCEVAPVALSIFQACLLHREFVFVPDFDAAVAYFKEQT
jgi:hypothetical protein